MPNDLDNLLTHLDLRQLDAKRFEGRSEHTDTRRIFGGLVLAQALRAASATVSADRLPHSQHAFFLRAGQPQLPILYEVDAIRDGGSFSTRRVVASQHGEAILNTSMSFQLAEDGLEHQDRMPQAPPPDGLANREQIRARLIAQHADLPKPPQRNAIEFRPVDPVSYVDPTVREPRMQLWMRSNGPMPADQVLQRVLLSYMSDSYLLSTSLLPHARSPFAADMICASLDHALWFHQDVDCEQWLLYDMDSPRASRGRGFSRGRIFNRQGVLVASTAQESLIRQRG